MKAITIKQPWASLIASGKKRNETRSWNTKYRGPVLIHAGKKIEKEYLKDYLFSDALSESGIKNTEDIPTGAIIAKVVLTECRKVIECGYTYAILEDGTKVEGDEFYFGDYSEGRYIWTLEDIRPIKPIPCKGQLSIWNYEGDIK